MARTAAARFWSQVRACARTARAFSSEVDTGSRQENASNQESRAPLRFHRSRKGSRSCLRVPSALAAGLILAALTGPGDCRAGPVKGEASFSGRGGYARLVIKLAGDVETQVTTA